MQQQEQQQLPASAVSGAAQRARTQRVNNVDADATTTLQPSSSSWFISLALIFLLIAVLSPLVSRNSNMLMRIAHPDGASLVQLMPAPCPDAWSSTTTSDHGMQQCFYLSPPPSDDTTTTLPSSTAQQHVQSFRVYQNKTGDVLPVWTIIGIRAPVLEALYENRKISHTERIQAPLDPCPDDPQCLHGIQVSCCRSNVGLAPVPQPQRVLIMKPPMAIRQPPSGTHVQTQCLDPRTPCYACADGHIPIISGHLLVGSTNVTVFICATPSATTSSSQQPILSAVPSAALPPTSSSCASDDLAGPKCQYKVGTCMSAKTFVPCTCDGHNTTCPICSNAVGPACGDASMSRNVRRMSLCGPDATHSVVTYDKEQCRCVCCAKVEGEGTYCGR